jgi:hypothetical protein
MSSQTVFFTQPSVINSLVSNVNALNNTVGTGAGIQTASITSTGTIFSYGDVQGANILNMQSQIKQLQTSGQSQVSTSYSYFGGNTDALMNNVPSVDQFGSKHVYEEGGLSSANLQHLQLDARTPYPTNIQQRYTPSFYEDSTGKYMYGVSIQVMQFGGFPQFTGTDNFARNTRREQFNLLQDIGSLTGSYSTAFGAGYTGFTTAFNGGFFDPTSDPWTYFVAASQTNAVNFWRIQLAELNAWAIGNFAYVYRYDTVNKSVIARTIVNMTRSLSGSGTNWQVATSTNGPVTSLQDGKFIVGVQNASTYGLLVFDKDLNPLVLYQSNQYAGVLAGVAGINPLNFTTDDQTNKTFGLGRDQVRTCLVKKWGFNELGTGTYRSLVDNQNYNIFSNNTGSPSTILYVNSSSQGQYSNSDFLSMGTKNGGMSPLNTAKWDASTGKLIAWALFTGASTATGCYSTGGWNLVPVMMATSQPDLYQKGDVLQSHSFTTDPLTGQTLPLYVWHQMVDIRTDVVNAATGYRSTGAWDEGYYQTTFSTGSSTSFQTAGIQTMNISVCGFTGAVYEYHQDVYGATYIKNGDGLTTGTYFSQNNFGVFNQILSDPYTRFYVPTSFDADRKYVTYNASGALLDTFIFTGTNGQYYNSSAQLDSSSSAILRQQILNNGFAVRYGMASYDLSANFNGVAAGGAGANPLSPIRPNATINPNQSPILADFLFPDGHAFSLTGTYDSQPFNLIQKDLRTWIGNNTLTNAASTVNPNYGGTQTYSATGIYNLVTAAQSQFSQKLVDVLLPGASYQPNPDDAGSITTVPVGSIVYRVKGAVFNGKPVRMTFQPGCANNQVLTQVMANQLNYFGGGGYGVNAFYQDSNGNWHILAGAANGNYIPFSEQVQAANYAARKTLQNLQNNTLPCSQTTLQKLGFLNATGGINVYLTPQDSDSLLTRPGAAFEGTTIRRVSDNSLVVECTIRGLWDFYASQTHNYAGYYGNGTGTYTDIRTGIPSGAIYNNDVAYSTVVRIPHTATGGYAVRLTDEEMIEVETLFGTMFGYRSECMSNRLRRVISNNSMCLDAKTLTLEHIIRGPLHGWELYNSENDPDTSVQTVFYGAGYKQSDNGMNSDEVAGQVCCGDTYNAIQSKTHIKVYKQSDILGARAQLISYAGRPNFACSYDGQLGQQITPYLKSDASTGYIYSYGNVQKFLGQYQTSPISGVLTYIGKYGGKDMFASVQVQDIGNAYRRSFRIIPISTKTKLNGFDSLYGGGAVLSPSGKSYIMARQSSPYRGVPWNLIPTQSRMYEGFVINDAGTEIDFVWRTAVSTPGDYTLLLGGPNNSTSVPSTTQAYNNGNLNLTMVAVNDLLISPNPCGKCVFIKLSTGEILHTIYGDDLDFSENWYATKTRLTDNKTTSQAPQSICGLNYNSGNLIMPLGSDVVKNVEGNSGRNIASLTVKYPAKQTMNMTSIYVPTGSVGAYNSQQVIFKWNEAQTMNGGLFCLLTTFRTSDQYNARYSFYTNKDAGYDALFDTGITAIGVYIPADLSLAPYQAVSRIINSKIVNGGSWYQRTGMSLATLMPYVQFMYAGQIPYDAAGQTPYIAINDIQVLEARQCRRQKKLLQEFYRAKNGTTAPYPDNGFYMYNTPYTFNTTYKNYCNITNGVTSFRDQTLSAVFNQPLGYTDVTPGRPLQAPLNN